MLFSWFPRAIAPAMAKNIISLIENDNLRHEIAEKGNLHIKSFDFKSAYEKFKKGILSHD